MNVHEIHNYHARLYQTSQYLMSDKVEMELEDYEFLKDVEEPK